LLDTAEGRADLVAELAAGCVTLGREVRVELAGGRSFTGRAEGLGPSGQLLVATGGEQRSVAAGDVVHLRAPEGGPPGGVQAGQ
jgi:BirA family biotin operon repressor/biotin-[acetyl-CoA-carboxylase] ligase